MIEAQPAPPGARCALHPLAEATVTCVRCGNYACPTCTMTVGEETRCINCKAQQPAPASEELSRLAATMIDGLLPSVPLAFSIVGGFLGYKKWTLLAGGLVAIGVLLALAVLGFNLYLVARNQQSIGKRILRIRVVRSDYEPATFGRIVVLRNLAPAAIEMIPLFGGLFSLADSLCIFRADKRCIHDHIADTIVVESEALSMW